MVQKRVFYEWSVRVPLVLDIPGGESRAVAYPVSLLDLLPTLLDLVCVPAEERLPVAGTSLFAGERPVFSEYHVEKVRAPSFMVREGRFKYVHTHGHDSRLFDLEADPGEWRDLASEVPDTAERLRAAILARFDPDRIAADGEASVRRRELIRRAMERNGTRWDYQPFVDATKQYVR